MYYLLWVVLSLKWATVQVVAAFTTLTGPTQLVHTTPSQESM